MIHSHTATTVPCTLEQCTGYSRRSGTSEGGFSLVEVTMAMGIAAIGLSIVFALVPASMDNVNVSADLSAEHRIFNTIIGKIRSGSWDEVDGLNETLRFFDAQSARLPNAEKDSIDRVYTAKIEIKNDSTGLHASAHSRRVVVRITNLPDYDEVFSDPFGNKRHVRTYSSLVSSMDK